MRVAEDNKGLGSEAAHPPPAPPPWEAVGEQPMGGMLTRGAHVACGGCGFGMARSWGCATTSVPAASPFPSCSSA